MFLFFSSCEGGGEGRGNLKCLRLQPGEGAGEKLSNEEGVIIYFISAKPSNPTSPGPRPALPHKKIKGA